MKNFIEICYTTLPAIREPNLSVHNKGKAKNWINTKDHRGKE